MIRTRGWATAWTVLRLAMAATIVAAISAQLAKSIGTAAGLGRDVTATIANFFSFFTILSNAAAAVVLAGIALWYLARGRRGEADAEPTGLAVALACVSTYMIITGIVYNTLLRHIELPQGAAPIPWSNEVLHLIAPLFLLLDVFLGPLRRALPWRSLWAVVAFPIVWVVYTMLRGPLVVNPVSGDPFWYPYPFLNPNNPGGWLSVILYVLGIAVAIVAVGALVVGWGRRRGRAAPGASTPGLRHPSAPPQGGTDLSSAAHRGANRVPRTADTPVVARLLSIVSTKRWTRCRFLTTPGNGRTFSPHRRHKCLTPPRIGGSTSVLGAETTRRWRDVGRGGTCTGHGFESPRHSPGCPVSSLGSSSTWTAQRARGRASAMCWRTTSACSRSCRRC